VDYEALIRNLAETKKPASSRLFFVALVQRRLLCCACTAQLNEFTVQN
jgi:hypothetical protein